MKIDLNAPTLSQLPADRVPKQASNGAISVALSATEDRTTFTSDSRSVEAMTSAAMKSPEIRQDKVAALRKSVSSGEYQIDPSKIAGSIAESYGK